MTTFPALANAMLCSSNTETLAVLNGQAQFLFQFLPTRILREQKPAKACQAGRNALWKMSELSWFEDEKMAYLVARAVPLYHEQDATNAVDRDTVTSSHKLQ